MLKAPAPTKTQSAFRTNFNSLNFTIEARQRKVLSTLQARFALAGYELHAGDQGDYLVTHSGRSKYCCDLAALLELAQVEGVSHE